LGVPAPLEEKKCMNGPGESQTGCVEKHGQTVTGAQTTKKMQHEQQVTRGGFGVGTQGCVTNDKGGGSEQGRGKRKGI